MNALHRLKEDLIDHSEAPPWTMVRKPDLALVLAVVEAAENAVGNVEDHQERRELRQALEALMGDKP